MKAEHGPQLSRFQSEFGIDLDYDAAPIGSLAVRWHAGPKLLSVFGSDSAVMLL